MNIQYHLIRFFTVLLSIYSIFCQVSGPLHSFGQLRGEKRECSCLGPIMLLVGLVYAAAAFDVSSPSQDIREVRDNWRSGVNNLSKGAIKEGHFRPILYFTF